MLLTLKNRFTRWLFQLRGAETGAIVLVQRRIFILPSRHGLIYVAALALMLTGSVNYNLSMGFVLTFLLTALGVNSIVHTFRNLARLRISPGRVQPVFAGSDARFILVIENSGALDRFHTRLRGGYVADGVTAPGAEAALDIAGHEETPLVISDMKMPGRDGLWLLEKFREQYPDTSVLILSQAFIQVTKRRCLRSCYRNGFSFNDSNQTAIANAGVDVPALILDYFGNALIRQSFGFGEANDQFAGEFADAATPCANPEIIVAIFRQ